MSISAKYKVQGQYCEIERILGYNIQTKENNKMDVKRKDNQKLLNKKALNYNAVKYNLRSKFEKKNSRKL